jgi:1-acyl-sn-glycerol-3-phosphate acyltransferase
MRKFITTYLVMPLVWLAVVLTCAIFFIGDAVVWLLTFWWDRRLLILQRYSIVWALSYIWVNPFWKINFSGKENVRKGQPYIIVSNHQSAFDIVLLYRLWMHFKWVAKRELFRIPFIGWNLWLNRHIVIDRASVSGAKRMILEAHKHLSEGTSVLIFPEGTRSVDGAIKRFKDGAFALAKKANLPILPVVINGSREVFPKNGYVLKGAQTFTMQILPEIDPQSFVEKSIDDLGMEVQELMTSVHKKIAPEYYNEK